MFNAPLAQARPHALATGRRVRLAMLCLLGSLAFGVDVVTQHNDVARSGANTQETVLTAANVNNATFGLLFTRAVDAEIYAQPLYLGGLSINGAVHNVVFACSENNTVYAFDADDPAQVLPLWSNTLGASLPNPPADVGTDDIDLRIGITSTPVIDRANGVMYVVAKSLTAGVYANTLYALDIATGELKTSFGGGAVAITATSPVNGIVMSAQHQQNRPGLLLLNGKLYLGFGSHGDNTPYNGWILEYDAITLAQLHVFCATDINAISEGAVWQSGNGLATDGTDIFFKTGNGDSTIKLNGGALNGTGANVGMSECFIRLSPSLTLLDWFMPTNADALNAGDVDLGSGGPLVIQPPAGPHYLFGAGKQALGYLVKTSQFTSDNRHWNATTDNVQATIAVGNGADNKPGMVFWNGSGGSGPASYIYAWGGGSPVMSFAFNPNGGGAAVPTLVQTAFTFATQQGDRAGGLSLSANGPFGAHPGTGILWGARDANILYAFNAETLTAANPELWDSSQNSARDSLGLFAKLSYPTIANGKVYVPTFSNTLNVYGLLASVTLAVPAPPSSLTATAASLSGIALTWNSNSTPVNSFSVQRATSAGGPWTTVGVTSGTTFADSGLSAATQYFYRVFATNAAGNSPSSNVATALTQPVAVALPAPWIDADIGTPGMAGSGLISAADVFSVSGGGADIWNAADQFNLLYQSISGDCQIVARVTDFSLSDGDPWQKAGVMIRQDTTAGAANALMPLSFGNGFSFQYRLTAGGASANNLAGSFTAPSSNWVKLTRVGNVLTGSYSPDGVTWTVLGTQTVTMTNPVLVGLAVTAHNNADLATATFDNVSITTGTGGTATITTISPADLPAGTGGSITISGTNLNGATAVTIGGTSVTASISANSATGLTVTAPAHALGAVPVVVTTPQGTASGMFSYGPAAPTISSINPATGPVTGGTTITITGTGLGSPNGVLIGGNPATITAFTATSITAITPAEAVSGAKSVIVTAQGQASNSATFTFTTGGAALPSISSVAPASGPYTGGTQITISGSQLAGGSGAAAVTIGGVAAVSYLVVNANTILAMTPPGTAANQPVVVTTAAGSSTTDGTFTYTGAPAASSSGGSHCGGGSLFGFITMLALAALLRVIIRLRLRP